jgi:nitroreductase
MDILEAILTRRSIRKFTGEPVSDEELQTVLRAGFQAPSAHNLQTRDFVIIKDKNKFECISRFHPYAKCFHRLKCVLLYVVIKISNQ